MTRSGNEPVAERTVVAAITLSLDGYAAGPGGDMSWLVEHEMNENMRAYSASIWRAGTTAVLGRANYEGFFGYWPAVAEDPSATTEDRQLAVWLNIVEKVVFSRSLQLVSWSNARIAERPLEAEVRALKRTTGGDILVLNSTSVIRQLLAADLVDELRVTLCPNLVGGGLRLFDGQLPPSRWHLATPTTFPTGALGLRYSRQAGPQ